MRQRHNGSRVIDRGRSSPPPGTRSYCGLATVGQATPPDGGGGGPPPFGDSRPAHISSIFSLLESSGSVGDDQLVLTVSRTKRALSTLRSMNCTARALGIVAQPITVVQLAPSVLTSTWYPLIRAESSGCPNETRGWVDDHSRWLIARYATFVTLLRSRVIVAGMTVSLSHQVR